MLSGCIFDLPHRRLQAAVHSVMEDLARLKNNIPETGGCLREWCCGPKMTFRENKPDWWKETCNIYVSFGQLKTIPESNEKFHDRYYRMQIILIVA